MLLFFVAFYYDRTLTPTFTKERPSEVLVTKIRRVGSTETSPLKLHAFRNSLNGTDFDANENNSEHWAKGVIKAMDFGLPTEYDFLDREAEFFLYSIQLRDFWFILLNALGIYHWGVVVKFEDGSVRTLEGDYFQFFYIFYNFVF